MIIMLTPPKELNVVHLGPGIHGCAVSSVSSLKLHTVFNAWACLNFSGEFRPLSDMALHAGSAFRHEQERVLD